jgi:hypothetical protein
MSKQMLKLVSDGMEAMGLEYDFETFKKKPIVYPYFVGQYTEQEPTTEDGLQESTFMLTGFYRGEEWLDLEDAKEKIENYFNRVSGKTAITDNGSAVAVFYMGSLVVPTGDDDLKSIQINLNVKEWKVNN